MDARTCHALNEAARQHPAAEQVLVKLWRMVLVAGLLDALRGEDAVWVGGGDFQLVCDYAEVDPDYALTLYRRRLPCAS